jgi:hypothetical protein
MSKMWLSEDVKLQKWEHHSSHPSMVKMERQGMLVRLGGAKSYSKKKQKKKGKREEL